MTQRKCYILLIFILFLTNTIYSQIDFEKLSFVSLKGDVTSARPVSAIAEDSYGFKWIGTNGSGLYRFDGTSYTSYSFKWDDDLSINSNVIYSIYIDSKNRLWVGTDVGLNFYNRELDRFERVNHKKDNPGFSQSIHVKCLIEDTSGSLLLGTYFHGVLKLNTNTLTFSMVKMNDNGTNNIYINALQKNSLGVIYAGTGRGLFSLDENKNELNKVTIHNEKINYDNAYIESLLFDSSDNLWIGTPNSGVVKMSHKDNTQVLDEFSITSKRILSMLAVGDNILIGTENDGLFVLDQNGSIIKNYKHNTSDKYSISSNSVWSLQIDEQKRIWLGTYDRGVEVYDDLYNKFESIESIDDDQNSEQGSSITGIQKDSSGKLWISMGDGIYMYDPLSKSIIHINGNNNNLLKGIDSDAMQTIFIDSKENIWIGSWNRGIYFLKKGSDKFVNYTIKNTNGNLASNGILSFSEDKSGRIWIASFLRGVHYYDPERKVFVRCDAQVFVNNGLLNSDVKVVFVDSKDTIWAGTTNGLFKISELGENNFSVTAMRTKMPLKLKNHPSVNKILSIYETTNNELWIGTNGGGLFSYDTRNDTFKSYMEFDGFNETSVNAITEGNDGSIWVSGKSGITNLDLQNNKVTNFTVDDGLLGNYFNNNSVFRDESGTLYFGGYFGINYFNPDKIKINKKEPALYFTNFKLFNKDMKPKDKDSPLNKSIAETKNIILTHDQSSFTIEYTGVNYTRPEKNQYAYFLEGVDPDWNFVENVRSASYNNLTQGDYTFKVKSANNDGVWNEIPLELKIKVLPPWWKTNLAYFLYLVCFLMSIVGISNFSRTRFKEKQAVIFEKNKRQEEEKLNKKKLQFFTNISHEFRTPLTLIMNPLSDIMNTEKVNLPNWVKEKHRIIYKNSDRLSRLINELMDFRKLQFNKLQVQAQEIDAVKQVKNILDYFEEEASFRRIDLHFEPEIPSLNSWLDTSLLEKILFNILSNAFKVTPDKGTITVKIKNKMTVLPLIESEQKIEGFEISVRDTGPGLNQKEYKKIFKRFYQVGKLNKSYYGSTGIGLEVVKDFVELQKGKIGVKSKVGEGTKFTVSFALGKDHFSKSEIFSQDNVVGSVLERKNGTASTHKIEGVETDLEEKAETVLIVEDNMELRNYLKNELKKSYNVISAQNGQKGLELAKEKLPNLIITDVVMPEMDGLELCKHIKTNIETSHIPLLMLTSRAMVEDRIKGIDAGADMYLSKPFNMDVLKSTLSQLLTSRQILFDKYYQGIAEDPEKTTTTLDNKFIQIVLTHIHENISDPNLSVEILASEVFLSRSQLYRKIKGLTGLSANEFIRKVRLEKAKEILQSNYYNVNEVAYKVGFSSQSYFTKCFKKEFGYLPTFNKG